MDDQFFELMSEFSKLGLETSGGGKILSGETCPVCSTNGFTLQDFVMHVYQCVKKFDAEDDEKLARKYDEYYNCHESMDTKNYEPVTKCPQGLSCTRQDLGHFKTIEHPLATCPCCQSHFQLYEIYGHISSCSALAVPADVIKMAAPTGAQKNETKENDGLSRNQMIAISSTILSSANQDSISEILETFGKLGFTKENLEKEIQKGKP
jgi:hypothetical protein